MVFSLYLFLACFHFCLFRPHPFSLFSFFSFALFYFTRKTRGNKRLSVHRLKSKRIAFARRSESPGKTTHSRSASKLFDYPLRINSFFSVFSRPLQVFLDRFQSMCLGKVLTSTRCIGQFYTPDSGNTCERFD
jgi:hypothetical protein